MNKTTNPTTQCIVCGQWKRQYNSKHEEIMISADVDGVEFVANDGYVGWVCAGGDCYERLAERAA